MAQIGSKYLSTLHAIISGQAEGRWLSPEETPERDYSCFMCFYPIEGNVNIFEEQTKNGFRQYSFDDICRTSPLQ